MRHSAGQSVQRLFGAGRKQQREDEPRAAPLPAGPSAGSAASSAMPLAAALPGPRAALLPPKPNALTPAIRGCVVSGQGSSVCCTRSGKLLEGNVGIGRAEVQVRRQLAMLQRQGRLHQAGNPRGRLQVADVGLHRADRAAAVRLADPRRARCPGPGPRWCRPAACRCPGSRRIAPGPGETRARA